MFSLALSEQLDMVHVAYVLVSCFYEFGGFFDVGRRFADIIVVFEGHKLSVDESVLDVLVA